MNYTNQPKFVIRIPISLSEMWNLDNDVKRWILWKDIYETEN